MVYCNDFKLCSWEPGSPRRCIRCHQGEWEASCAREFGDRSWGSVYLFIKTFLKYLLCSRIQWWPKQSQSLSSRSLSRLNTQGSVQLQPGEWARHVLSSSMIYTCCSSAWDTFTQFFSCNGSAYSSRYDYYSLCETSPRLFQIPNLQNYELLPSHSRIFCVYRVIITVIACLPVFLQTRLWAPGKVVVISFMS